jgi:hypothetical protein
MKKSSLDRFSTLALFNLKAKNLIAYLHRFNHAVFIVLLYIDLFSYFSSICFDCLKNLLHAINIARIVDWYFIFFFSFDSLFAVIIFSKSFAHLVFPFRKEERLRFSNGSLWSNGQDTCMVSRIPWVRFPAKLRLFILLRTSWISCYWVLYLFLLHRIVCFLLL